MRNRIANEIFEFCKRDKNGFLIVGDAGFGVWDEFKKQLPQQFLNTGINEQATVGIVSGLALNGHKVFYYNIIPFVLMRCYEQVRNDICYQELPVVLIGIGSGITYAPAGMTHYSVEDITIALSLPNLQIFSPADPAEGIECLRYAIASNKPSYIRIAKSGDKILHTKDIDITKPNYINKSNSNAVLLVHGSIVDEVEKILDIIDIDVVTVPFINSDFDWEEFLRQYEYVFSLEEHFVNGGFGSLLRDRVNKRVYKFGIKNEYIHKIGNRDYLRKYYKIDGNSVGKRILEIMNSGATK
ncbi:transketolase family protein [Hippea jasoniae]|uniref:transketolase family protein n=1 Tax=Hippea jasoniae TaxID=944479 RepID=UPI000551F21E|nr:transketolase [Hippea jasoniae]